MILNNWDFLDIKENERVIKVMIAIQVDALKIHFNYSHILFMYNFIHNMQTKNVRLFHYTRNVQCDNLIHT